MQLLVTTHVDLEAQSDQNVCGEEVLVAFVDWKEIVPRGLDRVTRLA